jgi:hypothetical protein
MDRGCFSIGIVILTFGIFVSGSWEYNMGFGGTDYFFFPWGLIILSVGSWFVYFSFKIKAPA